MAEPFSMAPNFSWVDEGDPVQAAAEAAAARQRQAAMPMGGRKEGKTTAVLDSLGTSIYNTLAKPSRIWGALGEVPMGQPLSERPDIVDAVAQVSTDLIGAPALMPGRVVRSGATLSSGAIKGPMSMAPDAAPAAPGIRAYHGSPHDFDRFDLSKIGTGEGAQSYGHGLYFAENEGVARSYKNDPRMLATRHGADWDAVQHNAGARVYDAKGDADEAIYQLRDRIRNSVAYGDSPTSLKELRDSLDLLKSGWRPPTGKMYEVNINAKPDQFLDWDKPIKDQPVFGKVESAVPSVLRDPFMKNAEHGIAGSNAYFNYLPNERFSVRSGIDQPFTASGAKTYNDALASVGGNHDLVRRILNPDKAGASEVLREAGIPGIKYADQGSRKPLGGMTKDQIENNIDILRADLAEAERLGVGKPDRLREQISSLENQLRNVKNPTSNYVLFDDKLVNILRKYALPGAVGGAAVPGSLAPDRGN